MFEDFFAYARERHEIYLRRRAGRPRSEWTQDPILQQFRFCNVYRELDTTTIWFRDHVRNPLIIDNEVLLATVLFRWFNRIRTGEAIFLQGYLDDGRSAWDKFLETGDTSILKQAILTMCGSGPYVTGSYIIKTPDGKDKLDGVLWCVEQFMRQRVSSQTKDMPPNVGWAYMAEAMMRLPGTFSLEYIWSWLRQFPYLGDFMAYEIVTDLRFTALLNNAPDIHSWANPGPGAMRGLNRVFERPLDHKQPREKFIAETRQILMASRNLTLWLNDSSHPPWEMREVEHTLCEWDKYSRVRLGQGTPRQRFK